MEQKVLISVDTAQVQKAVDEIIEAEVTRSLRKSVDKLITEKYEGTVRGRMTTEHIDMLIEKSISDKIYSLYGGQVYTKDTIRQKFEKEIKDVVDMTAAGKITSTVLQGVLDGIEYKVTMMIHDMVKLEIKSVMERETRARISEIVKETLSKVRLG